MDGITASDTVTLDKIDRAEPSITLSVESITETSVTIKASANAACDVWKYEKDGSGTWNTLTVPTGQEATFTVSGLTVDRVCSICVKARKKLNHIEGKSPLLNVTTTSVSKLNGVGNITVDTATVRVTVYATINNASCTHKLELLKDSTVIVTVSPITWSTGTGNRSLTLTARQKSDLQSAMSDAKRIPLTARLTSYSGNTQMGSPTTAETEAITIESNSAPTIEGMTVTEEVQEISTQTHETVFIQHASVLGITPGRVSARNGASITKYAVYCGSMYAENTNGSMLTIGPITDSGEQEVRLIITDSRGYTASVSQMIDVLAHTDPELSTFSLARDATEPSDVNLSFSGEICRLRTDGELNGIAYVQYRYKQTDAETYGEFTSLLRVIALSGTSFSVTDYVIENMDEDRSYDFHLQLIDNFGAELNYYTVLTKQFPVISIRDGMVGINVAEPTATLEVGGGASFAGQVKATSFSGSLAPSNLSSAVTVAKGGTGATSASTARSNLGIKATSLYNGTLTTGTTTFSYSSYKAYSIIGTTVSGTARCAVFVPKLAITTSNVTYCYTDGRDVQTFQLKYSGSTVTLTMGSEGGSILRIFGIN